MCLRTTITATIILTVLALHDTAMAQLWLEPRCKPLPLINVTQLVTLRDGRLLTMEGPAIKLSSDDGKTWSAPRKIYDGPAPGIPTHDYSVLFATKAGTLLVVFMDASTEKFNWDSAKKESSLDSKLDVWAIRSLDDGKTWIDRQKILDGYCGALIGMVQTSRGQIVAPLMDMVDRNRHAIIGCVSPDDGKTWQRGNIIDLGGRGNHDGAMEPTVAELSNGRLLMLIRTNLDFFWEAYSNDGGRYWREFRPSQLDASTSPGYLIRLASGRLALLWNRRCLEGKSDAVPGGGPDFMERQATSWQRAELSLAFSEDDAKTWTKPVVIARQSGAGLSYPFVLERRPGELWVITRYPTKTVFSLKEADFVQK
jgi:sialidase-1